MGDVSGELFTMLVEEGVNIYSGFVVQLFSTVRTTQIKYTNTKAVSTRETTKRTNTLTQSQVDYITGRIGEEAAENSLIYQTLHFLLTKVVGLSL